MDFLDFLNESVSPWHTVECLERLFVSAGFEKLQMTKATELKPGASYVFVRGAALVAVKMPAKVSEGSRFRIALGHTDFPALKVCPNPDYSSAGACLLHTEVYGSPLFTSWLDRDLGYAGMVAFEKDGKVCARSVRGSKVFRIPELAIHMNRGVNQDGMKVNPQVDFDALWRSSRNAEKFADVLQRELNPDERLLDFDVQLFDSQPAVLGGFDDEWVFSGRLDNLSSCHAIASAMLDSDGALQEGDFCVACFCNNEEVGSETREGACGNLLQSVLEYHLKFACGEELKISMSAMLEDSFALSIDMAHALHPNHPEKHEDNHAPLLGGGIVLKTNAQKRYASDALSSARLRLICDRAGVSLQTFVMRNDMPCGSTVGPTVSSQLGIPTVDIGEPMLSMHSIREMTALKDHEDMIRVVRQFFEASAMP